MPKMTVQDLIFALKQFNPKAPVLGTWGGITRDLEVYLAANGTVLVDADNGDYKAKWQKLKCVVCGSDAKTFTPDEEPVCFGHQMDDDGKYESWREKALRCATTAGALDPGAMVSYARAEQVDFEELDTWFYTLQPHWSEYFEAQ